MKIYIEKGDMPECCAYCQFANSFQILEGSDEAECGFICALYGENEIFTRLYYGERLQNCPLNIIKIKRT